LRLIAGNWQVDIEHLVEELSDQMLNAKDCCTLHNIINLVTRDAQQELAKVVVETQLSSVLNTLISNLTLRIALVPSISTNCIARPGE
jgi:hypothetical protein